jgi:tRNA-dihydrouridine synthase B
VRELPWASPYLLAPMAGLTTSGVRELFYQWGAAATSTGLLDAVGLAEGRAGSLRRARATGSNQILQLFGREEKHLCRSVEVAESLGFEGIELNLGCPSPALVKRGCCVALMKEPLRVASLLKAMRAATPLAVGLKCRTGFVQGDELYRPIYDAACESESDWFSLHPRCVREGYEATPHYDILDYLSTDGPALVTGGSLQTPADVLVLKQRFPHLSAVIIGRAAFTRPGFFEELGGKSPLSAQDSAQRVLGLLGELATDLERHEAARILPALMRIFGLTAGSMPQLDLIQPQRRRDLLPQLVTRFSEAVPPEMKGNPFLRL